MTKDELTIDLVKGAMASAEGLGEFNDDELRMVVEEVVRICSVVADETIKRVYTQGDI